MCYPWVPTAVQAAATVVGGVSKLQEGRSAAAVARYNARQLENEAIATREKGVEEEMKHREQVQQMVSRQKTQAAANGLDFTSGTPAALIDETNLLGEADSLRIRKNFQQQANVLDDRADLTTLQGKAAKRAGQFGFAGSLLSAAGTALNSEVVADKWYKKNA